MKFFKIHLPDSPKAPLPLDHVGERLPRRRPRKPLQRLDGLPLRGDVPLVAQLVDN